MYPLSLFIHCYFKSSNFKYKRNFGGCAAQLTGWIPAIRVGCTVIGRPGLDPPNLDRHSSNLCQTPLTRVGGCAQCRLWQCGTTFFKPVPLGPNPLPTRFPPASHRVPPNALLLSLFHLLSLFPSPFLCC